MDAPQLMARLNSAGTYVACGITGCRTKLAAVFRLTTAEDMGNAGLGGEPPVNIIRFLPGWAPRKDRVWAFSEYAKHRKYWGKSVKLRRYPDNDGLGPPHAVMDRHYAELPALAKCPKCGFPNLVTTDQLDVALLYRVPAPLEKE